MKRAAEWLLVIFFSYAIGVITAFLWSPDASDGASFNNKNLFFKLPIRNFCEVRNNPDNYDGEIIRLRAGINTGNHGDYLYDERCPADEKIKDYYDATAAVMYADWREREKVANTRNARKSKPFTAPVSVVAVGKFRKNEPVKNDSGLNGNAVFHFAVISLESVSDDDN